jgi:long-subunit acyl-CoA synthetase (AMP-forming)
LALTDTDAESAAVANAQLGRVRERLGLAHVQWLAVAAAPTAYEILEFHHALGLNLAELWGQTEFMMATMNPPNRIKLGTVGIALPSVQIRCGEDGELLLRGGHACSGYRNNPKETERLIDRQGWVHSGDLARIDDDGYVTIVGRKKEQMINSSGKNLSPLKIENAISQASPLLAYVVSIGDRRRFVTALIVLDHARLAEFARANDLSGLGESLAGTPQVLAEVERAVAAGNQRLSRVEQVRAWKVMNTAWEPGGDEVTSTMKLRREAIAEKYADEIEALYR